MAVSLALSQGTLFGVAGGYPFALATASDYEALGVLPTGVTAISVDVSADNQADVHLSLLYPPTVSNGPDGEVVTDIDQTSGLVTNTYQVDALGVGVTSQTMTLAVPTTKAPAVYVFRLWVDNVIGGSGDTLDRNADGSVSDEPLIPGGVNVSAVYVS